jgi:FAD/FMN-containing dehydrogenase
VESVVKWANKTGVPLIPVSSGAPHYRDDTAPGVPEAVMVDLSGMKKVLSINVQHRVAVIEPGVTYGELEAALNEKGMRLSGPLAPKKNKSVVASLLEREPRLNAIHQWAFTDPLRCMEVTWGDGNRMYTGEAGGSPMDLERQWKDEKWQVEPVGPMMLDFYRLLTGAQGTMGIVTWASVRCELLHKAYKAFVVPGTSFKSLTKFIHQVVHFRFSDDLFVLNRVQLAALLGADSAEINTISAKLPEWSALVGIGGRDLLPEKRVAQQQADIADIAQLQGLLMKPAAAGFAAEDIIKTASSPCEGVYWKERQKGAFHDIFFLTTLGQVNVFIDKMYELAYSAGFETSQIGVYVQPVHLGSAYHVEFTLPYNLNDISEAERAAALYKQASQTFASMNAFYSRPYGLWASLQMNRDAVSKKALEELKLVFDPNLVLNPGKLCLSTERKEG